MGSKTPPRRQGRAGQRRLVVVWDGATELVTHPLFLSLRTEKRRAVTFDRIPNLRPLLIAPPSLNAFMHTQREQATRSHTHAHTQVN